MNQMCINLLALVLPPQPLRQWVLTLPYELRAPLGYEPGLMSAVTRAFADSLTRWYARRLAPASSAEHSLFKHSLCFTESHPFAMSDKKHSVNYIDPHVNLPYDQDWSMFRRENAIALPTGKIATLTCLRYAWMNIMPWPETLSIKWAFL
jgi:hypothetical protein